MSAHARVEGKACDDGGGVRSGTEDLFYSRFYSECWGFFSEGSEQQLWPPGLGDKRTPRPFSSPDLRAFVMQMAAGG